jgi:hypothetical protein
MCKDDSEHGIDNDLGLFVWRFYKGKSPFVVAFDVQKDVDTAKDFLQDRNYKYVLQDPGPGEYSLRISRDDPDQHINGPLLVLTVNKAK